jgi:hypothetical protein
MVLPSYGTTKHRGELFLHLLCALLCDFACNTKVNAGESFPLWLGVALASQDSIHTLYKFQSSSKIGCTVGGKEGLGRRGLSWVNAR